jgi:Zn-finger nucleic acid-binding protein
MKCPKCSADLAEQTRYSLQVDACPACGGLWLDAGELDQLEDQAYDDDAHKGSLMVNDAPTRYACPHCGDALRAFQYRLHSLTLEYCSNQHGFWLDADEERRVLEIMRQREQDIQRKEAAEAEFSGVLRRLRRPSLFRGRPPTAA